MARSKARRMDLSWWAHVQKGAYRTKCGRGSVVRVGPNDWAAHVGPPGAGRPVGNGSTAAEAAAFVERALGRGSE